MKYFTEEEATKIMQNAPLGQCGFYPSNPNFPAMQALDRMVQEKSRWGAIYPALIAFQLGRATGVREERARRRRVIPGPQTR